MVLRTGMPTQTIASQSPSIHEVPIDSQRCDVRHKHSARPGLPYAAGGRAQKTSGWRPRP
jgi:hypothetical protein